MPALLSGLGLALGAANLDTVLIRSGRNIAGIFPDVVIEERHRDEIEITRQPVEQGSPMNDHAFRLPPELVMRVGWTDSQNLLQNAIRDIGTGNWSQLLADVKSDLSLVYQQLLDLQSKLEPFDVVTGKRSYSDMMLRRIEVDTNYVTENALIVEATFQQVFLVQTRASLLPPVGNQALTQLTAPTVNMGTKQPRLIAPFSPPTPPPFSG